MTEQQGHTLIGVGMLIHANQYPKGSWLRILWGILGVLQFLISLLITLNK